jgi:hypothetical protein
MILLIEVFLIEWRCLIEVRCSKGPSPPLSLLLVIDRSTDSQKFRSRSLARLPHPARERAMNDDGDEE